MKQNHNCSRWTALALAALLVLCIPTAFAQEDAPGVSWDMTVEDMFTLEGVTQDNVFILGGGDYTQYGLLRAAPAYVWAGVYVFRNDTLVMYGDNISSSMQQGSLAYDERYGELLAALTEEYGEPTLDDSATALDAANTVEPDSINPEAVLSFAGWDLGGGVALYHLHLKDETEESIITIYVNAAQLYGAE